MLSLFQVEAVLRVVGLRGGWTVLGTLMVTRTDWTAFQEILGVRFLLLREVLGRARGDVVEARNVESWL